MYNIYLNNINFGRYSALHRAITDARFLASHYMHVICDLDLSRNVEINGIPDNVMVVRCYR